MKVMSYMKHILSLLSGVEDAAIRIDVMRAVEFLREVFMTGRASENEIRNDLVSLLLDVILTTKPELTPEEAKQKAEEIADNILREWRIESGFRRVRARLGLA